MNPFINALSRMVGNPFGSMQQIMNQISQFQQRFKNPQTLVNQFFSDVPEDLRNDPDKIVQYLIRNGRISQQQIDQLSRTFPHK